MFTARNLAFLDLLWSEQVLPTLMREVLRLIEFLGPNRIYISIFENGSTDRTKLLLNAFRSILELARINHTIVLSFEKSDFKHTNRIELLARYRNRAIEPMFSQPVHYDRILFINDVFHCLDDTLELLYQTELQQTDITCGFDYWEYSFRFYDVWVARSMSGNMVREYFYQGSFVYDPPSRARYELGLPLQGYSCWNGMAVLNTEPFYKHNVRFRRSDVSKGECASSECQLIAKDFWDLGYGRVLMVPQAKVVYDLKYHSDVRTKKLDLVARSQTIADDLRYQDLDGLADQRRTNLTISQNLDRFGGLPLNASPATRKQWLGWIHEPEWVVGRTSELVDFVYPGPDRVVCFGLEGDGNPDADWAHPIFERVPYAAQPVSHDYGDDAQ
eukprot:jgi/Hompol1/3896/HPOL_001657-RA